MQSHHDQKRYGFSAAGTLVMTGPLVVTGAVVAVIGRVVGVWWLNACRIVYVVNESGPITDPPAGAETTVVRTNLYELSIDAA